MIAIEAVFISLIFLFGIIGMSRGWVRELIATAGIIVGLFIINSLAITPPGAPPETKIFILTYIVAQLTRRPFNDRITQLVVQLSVFGIVTFFSYYGPTAMRTVGPVKGLFQRARVGCQEALLGFLVGLINGYLIAGTIWYYLHLTDYPLPPGMWNKDLMSATAKQLINYLPENFLTGLTLYGIMAILLLFIFVAIT
jgi:uncharacterized membrane protein required for colicin V production